MSLYMEGKPIEKVEQFVHLGNLIGPCSMNRNIESCVNKCYSEINIMMAQFGTVFLPTQFKLFHHIVCLFMAPKYGIFLLRIYRAWHKA